MMDKAKVIEYIETSFLASLINDEEITGKELEQEIKRAEGIVKVSNQIIMNAELAYKVAVLKTPNVPEMLEIKR